MLSNKESNTALVEKDMKILNMDIGTCEKPLLLDYKKVFYSVPHSERTHVPLNNIFNV